MARKQRQSRATREALEMDRLRQAVDVIATLDGIRVRNEQLAMERGRMEAQARMQELSRARLAKDVEQVDYDLWLKGRQASDTANLLSRLKEVDPDDSDALEVLTSSRAGFIYAGNQEKMLVDGAIAAAQARRQELDQNEQNWGVRAEDYMIEVPGSKRSDGSPIRRLDRRAYGDALRVAQRSIQDFRKSLTNFQDLDRFDTLIEERKLAPKQAQQVMQNHLSISNVFTEAAALGVDPELLAAAEKAAKVTVRSTKARNTFSSNQPGDSGDPLDTSTEVFIYQDLDKALNTRVNRNGPSLREAIANRKRQQAIATESQAVADDRSKGLKLIGEALRLLPEQQRIEAAKAYADAVGANLEEVLTANQAVRNVGSADADALKANLGEANAATSAIRPAIQETPTSVLRRPVGSDPSNANAIAQRQGEELFRAQVSAPNPRTQERGRQQQSFVRKPKTDEPNSTTE